MDQIGSWSQAELRRFIVNLVLSDPGALPKSVASTADVTQLLAGQPQVPVGSLVDWAGGNDPADGSWLLADGRALSRAQFSVLFGLLGTTYGTGDGSTTFNIPDLRGRVTVGPDNMGTAAGAASRLTVNGARGNASGEEKHTLTVAELASHNHLAPNGFNFVVQGGGTVPAGSGFNWSTPSNATQNTGGDSSHNNMQPFQIVNKIIRIK